jgi:TonB family protein
MKRAGLTAVIAKRRVLKSGVLMVTLMLGMSTAQGSLIGIFPGLEQSVQGDPESPPQDSKENDGSLTQLESSERVYAVGDPDVDLPVIVKQTMPSYTAEAIEARQEGKVVLKCVIRQNGRVTDCEFQQDPGFGLGISARREIQQNWRFRPATLNGSPVNVRVTIETEFLLGLGSPEDKLTPEEAEHLIVGAVLISGPKEATEVAYGLVKTLEATPFDVMTFLSDRERLRHSDQITLIEARLYRNQLGGVTVQFKVLPK